MADFWADTSSLSQGWVGWGRSGECKNEKTQTGKRRVVLREQRTEDTIKFPDTETEVQWGWKKPQPAHTVRDGYQVKWELGWRQKLTEGLLFGLPSTPFLKQKSYLILINDKLIDNNNKNLWTLMQELLSPLSGPEIVLLD